MSGDESLGVGMYKCVICPLRWHMSVLETWCIGLGFKFSVKIWLNRF